MAKSITNGTYYTKVPMPVPGQLGQLTDVNIISPQNGDVLIYNSTTAKWENGHGVSIGGIWKLIPNKPQIDTNYQTTALLLQKNGTTAFAFS